MRVAPFTEIADALEKAARLAAADVRQLEITAAIIGLPRVSADLSTFNHREHASRLADACKVFRGLVSVEHTVLAVLSSEERRRA